MSVGCDEGDVPELQRPECVEPMSDIEEGDVLRNANADGSITTWMENPEPSFPERDPQTILDTEDATADAYLWQSMNSSEAWLQYEGELAEIEE